MTDNEEPEETWCGIPVSDFLWSFPLHFKQSRLILAALSGSYRIMGAITGIQWGKSAGTMLALAILVVVHWELNDGAYLVAAPNYTVLEGGLRQSFNKVFNPLKLGDMNENKHLYNFRNGHRGYFRSMDAQNALEGVTEVLAAVADEVGQVIKRCWTDIQARCSPKKAPLFFATNAYRIGWLLQDVWRPYDQKQVLEFTEKGKKRKYEARKYMFVVRGTSDENPGFHEDLPMQRRRMGEEEYRRKYTGDFQQMVGLVYQDFSEEKNIKTVGQWEKVFGLPYPRIPLHFKLSAGVDWGHKNPFGTVVVAYGPDGTSQQIDEVLKHHLAADNQINEMLALQEKWDNRIDTWHCDHDPKMVAFACEKGLNAVNADKSAGVRYGISQFKSAIRTRRRQIFEYCEFSIASLQTYHEREQKNPDAAPHENPAHTMSELPDCMRYDYLGNIETAEVVETRAPIAPDEEGNRPWEQTQVEKAATSAAERIKLVTQRSDYQRDFMTG